MLMCSQVLLLDIIPLIKYKYFELLNFVVFI